MRTGCDAEAEYKEGCSEGVGAQTMRCSLAVAATVIAYGPSAPKRQCAGAGAAGGANGPPLKVSTVPPPTGPAAGSR